MSFGDIAHHTPLRSKPPLPSSPPSAQLQGSLNALAANNAALRRLSRQLRSEQPLQHPSLKQVRELREQNRDIARIAANFSARIDAPHQRASFQHLVEDFSHALRESIDAERHALQYASSPSAAPVGDGAAADAYGAAAAAAAAAAAPQVEDRSQSSPQMSLTESEVAMRHIEEKPSRGYGTMDVADPLVSKSLLQTPNEAAVMREIRSNDAFVRERNVALTEIQTSVDDVNSIFKDLAVMIGDQRSQIDYVEVAVGEAGEHVTRGRQELIKTQTRREHQKGLFFCLLLSIALIIALSLIILLN